MGIKNKTIAPAHKMPEVKYQCILFQTFNRDKWKTEDIQSLLSRVCVEVKVLRESATQITTTPTTTTTIVAHIGTAIFKSTHSGIHGNSIFISGASLTGAMVPAINKNNAIYLYGSFLFHAKDISQWWPLLWPERMPRLARSSSNWTRATKLCLLWEFRGPGQ